MKAQCTSYRCVISSAESAVPSDVLGPAASLMQVTKVRYWERVGMEAVLNTM